MEDITKKTSLTSSVGVTSVGRASIGRLDLLLLKLDLLDGNIVKAVDLTEGAKVIVLIDKHRNHHETPANLPRDLNGDEIGDS